MSEPKTAEVKVVPSGWRTMESAPGDGTEFLAREDGGDLFRASFHEEGYIMSFCGQPVVHTPDPTHWMPLPAAPGEEAASPPAETGEGEHEARRDAWSDFESDHLTNGKGKAAADVYLHCRSAFDAAWPRGRDGAIAAAIAALPSGWPTVKITHPASDQSDTERMRASLKRAKAVLENTAVSNALRVVGAHEIIGAALAEKADDQ